MAQSTKSRIARFVALVLVILVGIAAVIAYSHRADIRDRVVAATFEASPRILEVEHALGLTVLGERTFLASEPEIGGRDEFSHWCAGVDHSEQSHVLGCFSNQRVYLFDVTDPRLDGIVEVTAAHELLHAAFSRLSDTDQARLTRQLQDAYTRLSADDSTLADRMSVYSKLSPTAFANELHSVLGTEVAQLPAALEAHYAEYFSGRSAVVEKYEQYHGVFTKLTTEAESLSKKLEVLRTSIEQRTAEYDDAVHQFNDDAAEFKARNERFEFSDNAAEFERIRASLLERQHVLETTLEGIQADTANFNELRERLIELNGVSVELNKVLDSTLPTPTTRPEPRG